ncbi:adhesion G -coupled receptor E4P [Paramuricea clavata]|uniref:Adhesion G -coupled receptor E4P, partial n=1 Tax=Paramuricea clavata TaxID=317549 RepID=A0A6S7HGR4_PARCT|nr:adhesion G -coupled receptor E4P [Paramuricea clavata]
MQCSGNRTTFKKREHKIECQCDNACYQTFSDCCPNYESTCGSQNALGHAYLDKDVWKCVEFKQPLNLPCKNIGLNGVWMIQKCAADWPVDDTKHRCENAPTDFSYPVEDFIPVVGVNTFTYRNLHCAACNGIKEYETWRIEVFSYLTPPDEFGLDLKLQFAISIGGWLESIYPVFDHPKRYCLGSHLINSCNNTGNISYNNDCVNGPVQVVSTGDYLYFKNPACAVCNGYLEVTKWKAKQVCVKPKNLKEGIYRFYFIIRKPDGNETFRGTRSSCPYGEVGTMYNSRLGFCENRWPAIIDASGELANEFLVFLSFKEVSTLEGRYTSRKTKENYFKSALTANMSLLASQTSEIAFHIQDHVDRFKVATFRVTITPYQGLILANQHKLSHFSGENIAFLKLINPLNINENFTLSWKEFTFTVLKVVSRQLSCHDGHKFQSYTSDVRLKLESGNYFELKGEPPRHKDLTLCHKLFISHCTRGTYVPLPRGEYTITHNLTVLHNTTMRAYKFGDYLINKNSNSHPSTDDSNSIIPRNATISICLSHQATETADKEYSRSTRIGVRVVTFISFSVSIICLSLFLITFGLFKELRNLRGMNLMNLTLSTFLSHLIWLISTAYIEDETLCIVFATLDHYLFFASFLAMTIISYHTCRVISQQFCEKLLPTISRWILFKYSTFVWLTPAIFVAICGALDDTETFSVDYGTKCWLGTTNAMFYLFLFPLAALILCNVYIFIRASVILSLHDKDNNTIQGQEGRQNLLFSIKLATLVGFPWLFVFFGMLFPDEQAFDYLFAVFMCLQGIYIALSYFFNQSTFELYKNRWNANKREDKSFHSGCVSAVFEMSFSQNSL